MKRGKNNPKFTKDWRRYLRKNATPAEKELWKWLRSRRFHGYRWCRQYGIWKYVLDFYCVIAKLAIELDGGVHKLLDKRARDFDKDAYLESVGIRVLHFTNEQIFNDRRNVERAILEALSKEPIKQRKPPLPRVVKSTKPFPTRVLGVKRNSSPSFL